MDLYQINFTDDIPVYRQLVDVIRASIKNGTLENGAHLPTVRELAKGLGIAQGTVKRAYDELGKEGLVTKIQGRGTFVCYRHVDPSSRKERAMEAIDRMLDALEGMDFSIAETKIYIDLKLRDRESRQENLKVAVVECNGEVLQQIDSQLRRIPHVDILPKILEDVIEYPYQLAEEMDLVITTAVHAEEVERAFGNPKKLARIAIRLRHQSVSQIVKLPADARVGILCGTLRYGELLSRECATYTEHTRVAAPCILSEELDLAGFLADKDAVLLPEHYESYCTQSMKRILDDYAEGHILIPCAYRIDEGSFMYVEEKLQRLWNQK